jgi:hypothetical protein
MNYVYVVILVISMILLVMSVMVVYKIGVEAGKHRERMNLLDILGTMPMMTQLIINSKEEYAGRYHSLYVVNYIIDKMRKAE